MKKEDNCVEPVDTSNYKICRTCDITVNKDIDKYVLKSSVPPCPDMKKFATKNMVGPNINMDDYILKSKIPPCPKVDMSQYILKEHSSLSRLSKMSKMPSLSCTRRMQEIISI